MKRFIAVASILVGSLYGSAVLYISSQMVYPYWYRQSQPPALSEVNPDSRLGEFWGGKTTDPLRAAGLPYSDVAFATEGGGTLRGWHVPHPDNASHIVVTGHGGGSDRRFFLRYLPLLHEAGYAALLFDFREHGASDGEGRGISFGFREHRDLLAAVDAAGDGLGYRHVALLGTSVGAASALMAAAQSDAVEVVIAENAYRSVMDLAADTRYQDHRVPGWLVRPAAWLALQRLGAGDMLQPIDAAAQLTQPVLYIHGSADQLVPARHSRDLYRATGAARSLWIVEGGRHSRIINQFPQAYEGQLGSFLRQYFPLPQ